MVTSFTRIVVVLSLLRTALSTGTAPPNAVIVSLALFLTAFVMGPAFQRAYDVGVRPMLSNEITPEQAFERSSEPFRAFMLKNVREKDLQLFTNMAREPAPATPDAISLRILVPAFMISELKRAFEIGFLLFLPFLIIDLVIASILMSMGMMMLPPEIVRIAAGTRIDFFRAGRRMESSRRQSGAKLRTIDAHAQCTASHYQPAISTNLIDINDTQRSRRRKVGPHPTRLWTNGGPLRC